MFFIVFVAVLVGALCMLFTQLLLLFLYFRSRPVEPIPHQHQYERAEMNQPGRLHQKETCLCLNALIAFLFQEMKDTVKVRRWVVKKMNVEFDELLTTKTAGRILEQINVRDYCLGRTFPTLKNVTLMKGAPPEPGKVPEEVDIAVDLEYNGGFRISVDVDLVFGTTAFVSVCIAKLKGRARLEFTRIPYTHWSFSFYDDPEIDFKVESHFEGRTVPQLGSLIVNQLRKTLKKKHTLPNYKLRYMPFFPKPEPPHTDPDIYVHDAKITIGKLNVTVVECSRLPISTTSNLHDELYCTVSIDTVPWKQEDIIRRLPGEMFDVEVNREKSKSVGVSFRTGSHDASEVVVASITADSPAGQTELKKGDIVLLVEGVRVNSTKHAAKLIKQTKEKFTLKVQRPIQQLDIQAASDDKRDTYVPEKPPDNDYEDFINVSIMTELGYATDDNDGTLKSAQDRLQVPEGGSPLLRHRRRLSSSLDYSTLRQVSASADREDRLIQIKALIRESMQPKSAMKKSGSINLASHQLGLSSTPTASSDMIHIPHDKLIDPDTISVSSVASLLDDTESVAQSASSLPPPDPTPFDNMYETTLVSAAPEPSWQELFTFDIKDTDKYLNVCVWHRVQTQSGEKDILLGYCCVPLVDVALQCLTTLSGEHLQLFKLHPPEQRAGASRHTGDSHLYRHPGFEGRLCHGDISLFFQHTPSGEGRLSKDEIDAQERALSDLKAKNKVAEERRKAQRRTNRPDQLNLHPGRSHRFVGTQFSVQTKCDFCSKKIWTKYALQCQLCMLICHKKCSEKTQAQITCDRNKIWHRADHPSPYKHSDLGISPQGTPVTPRKSPHQSPYPSPTPSPHESSQSSDEDEDDIDTMVRKLNRLKRQLKHLARTEGNKVDDTDAVFMTAAREMGRELYMDMKPDARKQKLETMVNKLQKEIDAEADRQLRLAQDVQVAKRPREKATFEDQLTRSEERMQTLAMMMLHYCAGIQHVNETSQSSETKSSIPVTQQTKAQTNGH